MKKNETSEALLDELIFAVVTGQDATRLYESLLEKTTPEHIESALEDDARFTSVLDARVSGIVKQLLDPDFEGLAESQAEVAEFQQGHEEGWSHSLHIAEVFLGVSRELCHRFATAYNATAQSEQTVKQDVFVRSYARGCRIASEVACLAKNGYSAGALTRWRTLHEVSVVCMFLQGHDEELSRRYVLYDLIDSFKSAEAHMNHEPGSLSAPSEEELDELKHLRDALKAEFGDQFAREYGWAYGHVKGNPSFHALQNEVERMSWFPRYKVASQEVHANSKPLFWNLGGGADGRVVTLGPSSHGLADCLHPAMLSLNVIAGILQIEFENERRVLEIKILESLARLEGATCVL